MKAQLEMTSRRPAWDWALSKKLLGLGLVLLVSKHWAGAVQLQHSVAIGSRGPDFVTGPTRSV